MQHRLEANYAPTVPLGPVHLLQRKHQTAPAVSVYLEVILWLELQRAHLALQEPRSQLQERQFALPALTKSITLGQAESTVIIVKHVESDNGKRIAMDPILEYVIRALSSRDKLKKFTARDY
jgi:hypothetical protein